MGKWLLVSDEATRGHPLRGFGGWLVFFSIGIVLGTLQIISTAVRGWDVLDWRRSTVPWAPSAYHALLVTQIVLILWLAISWFRAAPTYRRRWALTILLGVSLQGGFEIALAAATGGADPDRRAALMREDGVEVFWMVCQTLIVSAIFYTYMINSRRFRVTFEHKLRFDDPNGHSYVPLARQVQVPSSDAPLGRLSADP